MRLDRLRFRPSALVLYRCGHTEVWTSMGFDRGRKGDRGGRGREKRDDFFGGESFTEQGGGVQGRGAYGGGGGGIRVTISSAERLSPNRAADFRSAAATAAAAVDTAAAAVAALVSAPAV